MSFLNKDFAKSDRHRRSLNSSGIYDTINVILGIGIIISSIVVFIDHVKYNRVFTIVFLLAAIMNLCMGVKYYHRREIAKTIALIIAGVFLIAMMIISFMALWI